MSPVGDWKNPLSWLGAALLGMALWYGHTVLLLLALAVLVAIFLNRLARFFEDKLPVGYLPSFFLVLLLIVGGLVVFGWTIGSDVAAQTRQLVEGMPDSIAEAKQALHQLPGGEFMLEYVNGGGSGEGGGTDLVSRAMGIFSTAMGAIVSFAMVLLMGLYLAFEPDLYRRGLLKLAPPRRRERASVVLSRLHRDMWRFLAGIMTAMAVIAVLTTIALWALGIPMFLALGLLAGLLCFVPYIGPLLSAVPAVLVALSISTHKAMLVLACYAGIQLLESGFITPLVFRDMVRLPPALTLFCQSLFGLFFGALGVILAAPATRATMTLLDTLYLEDDSEGDEG